MIEKEKKKSRSLRNLIIKITGYFVKDSLILKVIKYNNYKAVISEMLIR